LGSQAFAFLVACALSSNDVSACYASEFLQAFAEMVRKAFGKRCRTGQIDFEMSPASGLLHSRALQDVMEHAFCA
jgi:hypothetical protein